MKPCSYEQISLLGLCPVKGMMNHERNVYVWSAGYRWKIEVILIWIGVHLSGTAEVMGLHSVEASWIFQASIRDKF